MAASAFTPNPGGSASATAPIFVSDDGGDSWTLRNTLPSQTMTADITHAVGGNPPVLYAGIMKVPDFPLNELKANDLFSPATMILQGFRADIDQPFVRTSAVGNADRVYIGLNDFDAPDGRTATVDVSLDGGATYTSRRIETRNTAGQNGPSIRPAVAQDHTVYVAYFGWRSNAGADVTSDVVVVRDDSDPLPRPGGPVGPPPRPPRRDPRDHPLVQRADAGAGARRVHAVDRRRRAPQRQRVPGMGRPGRDGRHLYGARAALDRPRRDVERRPAYPDERHRCKPGGLDQRHGRPLVSAGDRARRHQPVGHPVGAVPGRFRDAPGRRPRHRPGHDAAVPVPAVHRRLQLPAHPREPVSGYILREQHARFRQLSARRGVSTACGVPDASAT